MEYGAHLPLIEFEGAGRTLADLRAYARQAAALDYRYLCANDHLLFGRPWLDGPTALAATIDDSSDMTLATTVCLPVIRGPVQSAKLLAAIDLLSGGRLVAGVGPGSSARDYAAVGVPFEERWRRFDESIRALRSLVCPNAGHFAGHFYSTEGLSLEPAPRGPAGPPIWIASWGSDAGLRRVARLGDGWLASGYNTTPTRFAAGLGRLHDQLEAGHAGRGALPNAIATMWTYVTDSRRDAERMLSEFSPHCSTARSRRCASSRSRSGRRSAARSGLAPSRTRARSGSSSGHSPMSCSSWSVSAETWCRSSRRPEAQPASRRRQPPPLRTSAPPPSSGRSRRRPRRCRPVVDRRPACVAEEALHSAGREPHQDPAGRLGGVAEMVDRATGREGESTGPQRVHLVADADLERPV